jgi:hypothetical protein
MNPRFQGRNVPDPARFLRALAAAAATGVLVYAAVVRVGLPRLARQLTPQARDWLRRAFAEHPFGVLAGVLVIAGILALPPLGVFRLVYGPFRGTVTTRSVQDEE